MVINYMFRPREYENAGFASDKQDLGAEEGEKTQITEADKQTAKFVLFHFWTYRKKNRKEKDMVCLLHRFWSGVQCCFPE